MQFSTVNKSRIVGLGWPGLLVALIICSLTFTLATRFCHEVASPHHVAKTLERRSVDTKRQNLNRDAIHWVPPLPHAALFEPVVLDSHVVSNDIQPARNFFEQSLYTRPPPSL